jgi:RNA polymerase sigma factor (sigma-70 family)
MNEWLTDRFEEQRPRLRALAYRMLGSLTEADDAVQDAWLRASRAGADDIDNLGGWLTTIVARVCLNSLRARGNRREEPFDGQLPDPVITLDPDGEPEQEALLADSVGLALQIVLESLPPAERLAFVLHDMFELPFDQIASILGRTPAAARQLASRGRRRLSAAGLRRPQPDLARQRAVVDAFFAAARAGDFEALLGLLDPDVVLRADFGANRRGVPTTVRGAPAVAEQARLGARAGSVLLPALVNGAVGVVATMNERPFAVLAFTVVDDRIVEIVGFADPKRVQRIVPSRAGPSRPTQRLRR